MKQLSIAYCMALIFLALWYGRDPSVFCAALACFYAMPPGVREWDGHYGETMGDAMLPNGWVATTGDRRRELVKAAALAIAEIERMDRAKAANAGGEHG